jgi:phospholipid/cholesterol/gamma-HCH transport system substrate-binding protein
LESKRHYTLIGLAVLLLTAGLVLTALWLSVGFDSRSYNTFVVYMNEPVSGLTDDSAVKYNGVKVGFINEIELNPLNPQQVKVTLKIEEGVPITISTQASLVAQGITGTNYLGLTTSSASLIPLQKKPNEPYPIITYKPSFYFELEQNITRLSQQINALFTPENIANVNQTLRDLPHLEDALENAAIRVDVMAQDVSIASKQFTQTMRTGKNTIEQLSQQTVPELMQLLYRLDPITANLEMVSNQIRQNPAVIIRGTSPSKPGPGE